MNKKIVKMLLGFCLSLCLIFGMTACGNNPAEVNWLSPMMSVDLPENEIEIYDDFELTALNTNNTTPAQLFGSNAVTRATLNFAYKGDQEYKARIGVRIDEIEVEEDGTMGHSIVSYGVSKTEHATVLFYADETWYDGAYGSNAASGGDTLFDERYYTEGTDDEFSATRRALLLNKDTAAALASLDFYIVGLEDGYYVLNFYVEEADAHGHFHGTCVLVLTSVQITVGTPVYEEHEEHDHEH